MEKVELDPDGKILGMRVKLIEDISMKMAKHDEDNILRSIIGSKILDFKLEKDERTKHMWNLTIITDAGNVPITRFHKVVDGAFLANDSEDAFYVPSMIKLRVRLS